MFTIYRSGRVLVRSVDAESAIDAICYLSSGTVRIEGVGRFTVRAAIRFLEGELAFA